MNVVQGNNTNKNKKHAKSRNELVRKEFSWGIRGGTSLPSIQNNGPRYQFSNNNGETTSKSKKSTMGPPLEPPRSLKRKLLPSFSSTKPDSSSSGKGRPKVLASETATAESDFCTPRNRPTALRYISSSSRGGYSGTRSARSSSTAVEPSVILAISEGRGMARGEIGIAAIDLKHPNLVLCQFSDSLLYTHTMTKINYFNPIEIIVPNTFCEGVKPNQLYQLIRDQYPLLNLTTVQRRHFNDAVGRQHIQTLCAPQYSAVYLQVLHKFYALTAAAAVLKYVEYIQCIVFARESLKIEYHSSENTMIIDVGTATQLELVQPLLPSAGATCCLLGVLGPTYTVGGIRALRAAILQPSCNKDLIENRLDAVQDLIENEAGLMVGLQDVVKKLSDIDRILLLCVEPQNQHMDKMGEAQLNQTLLLKTTMEMVPKLVDALNAADSGRLKKIRMVNLPRQDFENPHYGEIIERIKNIIQDDAHLEKGAMGSLQRCFAVKPDINGLLDVARRTYSELIDDIQKIVELLGESYDLPIRLNQNMMKGFHIVMTVAPKKRRHFNVEDLPPIFIQVQNNGSRISMSTEELVVLDQQAKESLNEIQKMSNIVIGSLLKDLRPFMSSLYKLCENVAELDILLAIAQASTVGSYIRPDFSNYLDIRNSIHPLLDYNSQTLPIPNDIYASPEQNFTIITGPNMGGKSIYIKQIAVLQIMAQLGCFLPATNAVLRICDRVFSRIGFNDSVELNASTYVVEIKETQHILKALTPSSLVIIDELCRGTSTDEGTSIAWAICEELLASDAFTFFTTHFMYLTRLQDLYYNVVNLHTEVREEEVTNTQITHKRLVYEHKVKPGVTSIENYGLSLAAKTNLPQGTVQLAWELAELINTSRKPQDINPLTKSDDKVLYELNAEITKESRRQLNNENVIRDMKIKFKEENPLLIERLKVQRSRRNNNIDTSNKSSMSNTRQDPSNDVVFSRDSYSSSEQPNQISNNRPQISEPVTFRPSDNVINDSVVNKPSTEYREVKCSNELLNTMIHHNDADLNQNITVDVHAHNDTENVKELHFDDIINNSNTNILNNESSVNVFNNDDSNHDEVLYNSTNVTNDSPLDSDSELADALTQIIECSMQDASEGSVISTDEDLMAETLNEILDDVILTPPLEFRDK